MTTVLFAGGGTGGHLMPALAIADAMVRLEPAVRPYFVGSERGIEARVLPGRPWPYTLLPLEPVYRRKWWRNASLPLAMLRALRGIRPVLERERPRLVVGTGGYVAGPVVWAATRRGIAAVLQEQNALPGLTTRLLAGRAAQVHLGFPEAARRFGLDPADLDRLESAAVDGAPYETFRRPAFFDSGNPITPPPDPLPDRREARRRLGFDPDGSLVLVMGGSQGAAAINEVVANWVESGPPGAGGQTGRGILWQTGAATYERFRARERPPAVRVIPFLDPISDAYAAVDLVVARAGAMTLAELAAWGLPSVLIPLPTAAADHQLVNARAMQLAGAAVLIEQRDLTAQRLEAAVSRLLGDPARLADMSRAARHRGRPHAARSIAAAALRLVSKS